MSKRTVFLKWNRGRGEVVRLVLEKYRGRDVLHLRIFYLDQDGKPRPTAQGVTIPREQLAPLRKGLRKAQKKLASSSTLKAQPIKRKNKLNGDRIR